MEIASQKITKSFIGTKTGNEHIQINLSVTFLMRLILRNSSIKLNGESYFIGFLSFRS
jgi:hypothetical protein